MFLNHFGLREYPFSITPDTSFFYESVPAQEALNTILMALSMGEGFIKITGEVGTGKSMLCRKLIASLDQDYEVALVLNPYREPHSLFLELCQEFNAFYKPKQFDNQFAVLTALTNRVLELSQIGKRIVICLDEAQAMPIPTLEALRLLTNMESEKRKLVQIVIFGQPELDERLNHPSIRQLKQRITFSYHLRPLTKDELKAYLRHRLLAAGHVDGNLFRPSALSLLREQSKSVPRMINILAHKSLLSAFGRGSFFVERRDVKAASKDTFKEDTVPKNNINYWLFVAIIILSIVVFVSLFQLNFFESIDFSGFNLYWGF